LQHGGAVDEAGRVARNEHEHFGGVAETVIPECDPADDVEWNMVEKNYPEPESAEQIEPKVTSKKGRKHGQSFPAIVLLPWRRINANPHASHGVALTAFRDAGDSVFSVKRVEFTAWSSMLLELSGASSFPVVFLPLLVLCSL